MSESIVRAAPLRQAQEVLSSRAAGVLMPSEKVHAIAACTDMHRWWFLPPRGVIVTDHRILLVRLGLFAGLQFRDFHWEHVQDVHLEVGSLGALVRVTGANSKSGMQTHAVSTGTYTLFMDGLDKSEAQAVYRVGQQMEQLWRERQRSRYMEEQRLGYTGAAYAVAPMHQAPAQDLAARVQQIKSLLDQGLITQAEFDTKKAEILRAV